MLDLDLGGVASAGKPLPEGDYEFLIVDATVQKSKDGNSHNLKLKLEVSSDEEAGRPHSENLNLQKSTRPFVKAFVTALWGVEDDEVDNVQFNFDDSDDTQEIFDKGGAITVEGINGAPLINQSIGGTIKHVTSDGRTYGNVIAWYHV
jgi:hypothetical protein